MTGARLVNPSAASAAVPTKQVVDVYDLSNLLIDSTRPTHSLIKVAVRPDGTIAFDMPRSENGQGIDTACAMVIADEMDAPLSSVRVTLADAKPELVFNQFTAGSVSMQELYQPLRIAAAAHVLRRATRYASAPASAPASWAREPMPSLR